MEKGAIAVVVSVLAVSAAVGGVFVGAGMADSTATDEEIIGCSWGEAKQMSMDEPQPSVDVDAGTERNGTVTYRLSFELPESIDEVRVVPINRDRVVATDGMERDDDGYVAGDGATITIERESDADGDGWYITRVPTVKYSWGGPLDGSCASTIAPGAAVSFDAGNRSATATQTVVLVSPGPHNITEAAGDEITHRVVVPEAIVGDEVDGQVVATELAATGEELQPGQATRVTYFAVPRNDESYSGLAYGKAVGNQSRRSVWVRADSNASRHGSIWTHEYVHTQQDFSTGENLRWFREASAEYFAYVIPHQLHHDADDGRANHFVVRDLQSDAWGSEEAVLADTDEWVESAQYTRGALLLLALDNRLRAASNGDATVAGLFRWMVRQDDKVTYAEFSAQVAQRGNESVAAWLDARVKGDAPLEVGDDAVVPLTDPVGEPTAEWRPEETGPIHGSPERKGGRRSGNITTEGEGSD